MIGRNWEGWYAMSELQSIFHGSLGQMDWVIWYGILMLRSLSTWTYCLTLGIESPVSESSTQKVNTRSLTELELVGVDDAIRFVEWESLYSKEQMKT